MAQDVLTKIGPYRIGREIGRGGMGVVYLARDTKLDRDVAIKAMSAELTGDPVKLNRFEREAKLLASLSHPNIAAIYALEEHDGARYLVLELVEGRMLKDVLAEGALPLEESINVGRQIAAALEAAHRKGVMHRDLKPSNVCLTTDGRVKVLDFGLAKSLGPATASPADATASLVVGHTIEGTIVGTPGYMSPEQTRGLSVDERADIWAFGCTLYECLTGRPVFAGKTVNDVMAATLFVEPDWAETPADLPLVVRDLVRSCLQKDPQERLQDIGKARALLEELAVSGSTVSTVMRPQAAPNNLPAQVTSFVGRRREMAELRSLLTDTRLLTLTGSGGCGKTRLALELAGDLLQEFPDGIWFAELAALTDPGLAPKSVATALGIKERPGEMLAGTLISHLREKRTLLVLDNCEHLLSACAELADALLHGCESVRLLVTGREGLGIAGETQYRVPSLSCPNGHRVATPEEVTSYEAVQLFVERASAAKPSFSLTDESAPAVVHICRRLDGIPLAIELAAARVRALSLAQIAERLDDSFRLLTGGSRTALPRHQTLRATIDWSYNLLSDAERTLLRRLSVFGGGWTLEAAERVCGDEHVAEAEILDLLTALVDRSLVVYDEPADGEGRYRMLQTVAEYAAEELGRAGEAESVRGRHLDYFLALAERGEAKLKGPQQPVWLDRLETERENILRALDDCEVAPDGAIKALRLTGSIWRFWEIHGHLATGAKVIAAALARPGAQEPTGARAAALGGAGFMALMRGEYTEAHDLLEQALTIRRRLGNETPIAGALSNLGIVVHNQGDYERARVLHEESLALRRKLGDVVGITTSLICLGNVARSQGRLDEARALYEQGLSVQEDSRDTYLTAYLVNNLGTVAHAQDSLVEARRLLGDGLSLRREIGDKRGITRSLDAAGGLAAAVGEPDRAARLFGAAERLRQDIGCIIQAADRERYDRDLAAARAALEPNAFDGFWAEGLAMKPEEAVQYALTWLKARA